MNTQKSFGVSKYIARLSFIKAISSFGFFKFSPYFEVKIVNQGEVLLELPEGIF